MIAGLFLLATAASYKLDAGVTPIQKVIEMMQEMVAKGKQEKHDEMVAFSTFSEFCKGTMDEKQAAIKKVAPRARIAAPPAACAARCMTAKGSIE